MMNVDGDVELASSSSSPSRRQFWKTVIASGVSLGTIQHSSAPANAFERTDVKFTYTINVPESMKEGSKPVKTHQDEVNFGSSGIRGYQYGITVDPVRINSLKEVRRSLLFFIGEDLLFAAFVHNHTCLHLFGLSCTLCSFIQNFFSLERRKKWPRGW